MDRGQPTFFGLLSKTAFKEDELKSLLKVSNERLKFHNDNIETEGPDGDPNSIEHSKKFRHQTLLETDVINSLLKYVEYMRVAYPNQSVGLSNDIVEDNRATSIQDQKQTFSSKKKVKIQDVSIMTLGGGSGTLVPKKEEEESARPTAQSVFKVHLITFDETKKVSVIHQVKHVVGNINLVQAKELVESILQVLRNNLSKADAETMKAKIEAAGGVCTVE